MSYNSLLTDPDLIARWNGDANGDGVGDVNDVQGNYNGTAVGGTVSFDNPPFAYSDGKTIALGGANAGYFDFDPAAINGKSSFTFCVWSKRAAYNLNNCLFGIERDDLTGRLLFYPYDTLSGNGIRLNGLSSFNQNNAVLTPTEWNHFAFSSTKIFSEGVEIGSHSITFNADSQNASIGRRPTGAGSQYYVGDAWDIRLYARDLTAAELAEIVSGPEPSNVTGTLASDGTYSIDCDDPNNGTVTYEWVVVENDGTSVAQGTGASGTATLPSIPGTYTLYARASNSGGYDVGDFGSRTTDYGSDGDGYYELASVTVEPASVFTGLRVHEIKRPIYAHQVLRPIRVHEVGRAIHVHEVGVD